MKALRWIATIFAVIGLGLLVGGGYLVYRTQVFLSTAASAPGVVTGLVRSQDSDGGSTYRPEVRFVASTGDTVDFVGSVGSSPPAYDRGEAVTVRYDPANPHDARLEGFFDLWFAPGLLGLLGTIFTAVGGGILGFQVRAARRREWLLHHGRRMRVDFTGVERNTAIRVNGRSPWRLAGQWLDPANQEIHLFQSEDLWFDPTPYLGEGRRELEVLVDPNDLRRHLVDVSFLPKVAE